MISVEVLEEEMNNSNPRYAVIRGMISNFESYAAVNQYITQIKQTLKKWKGNI